MYDELGARLMIHNVQKRRRHVVVQRKNAVK